MNEHKITNAVIKRTMLGKEDHGIFTFMLHLDYGHSGQGAGGYCLSHGEREKYVPYVGKLIQAILDVVGVEAWEDLPGKHIRARYHHSKVEAIGHFLEDKWLDFGEFFNAHKEDENE